MGTRVMKHVVMGVQEERVTNRKEPAVLVVNKTGQGVYVMVGTLMKIENTLYDIQFKIKLIETEKNQHSAIF